MHNPYWHAFVKAHQIEPADIELLVFEIYNVVRANMGLRGAGVIGEEDTPEETGTDLLHREMAEGFLSKRMLQLAMLIRTIDDHMDQSEFQLEYKEFCNSLDNASLYGSVYEGDDRMTATLRECCNKIIHGRDFRPVYDTDDDREDPKCRWEMVGTIEIKGVQGKRNWSISIEVFEFLESALKLSKFVFDDFDAEPAS